MSELPKIIFFKPALKATKKLASLYLSAGLLLCCTQFAHAENSSHIVKWKDDKGATHYGDKIPPQYANRENTVINRQGVTVQHNKPINYDEHISEVSKLAQDKKDKALLGAFTNADEIDLARDRNIQLDLIALENIQQEKINHQKRLAANKMLADNLSKRKKPIPNDLNMDIAANVADIAKVDQRISERKQVIENTKKRFDEDKKRYISLKNPVTTSVEVSSISNAAERPAATAPASPSHH